MKRFILCALLAGCSPLSEKATIALVDAIRDRSSCVQIGAWGGGGTVTATPVIPIAGWHGSVWVARAMPEHSVTMDGNGCQITAVPKGAVTVPKLGEVTTLKVNPDGSTTITTK